MHLYNNLRFEALKQFKSLGGTHVFLVSLLSTSYNVKPVRGDDFRQIFDFHIETVKKANEIVKAYAIIGVHPAEITIIGKRLGFERAAEIMKHALDIAGKYVEEGKAVAIKSGRPHYVVPSHVWRLSNEVLMHAFEVAKDIGCAIQLHTESFTVKGMNEIRAIADRVGLKANRIVKHFSPPAVKEFIEIGMFPSVIASGDNVIAAAGQSSRFVVETDYIDDRKKPGSVLGPKTVPRKIKELLNAGFDEDVVYKICVENPKKIYGVEIEV
jgi:TatD-related deoxyribonuclease